MHLLRFQLSLLLVALLAVAPRAAISQQTRGGGGGGATTKGPVTIQLPAGWVVVNGGVLSAQAPQPDRDATGSFQASIQISQSPGNRVDIDAEVANVAKRIPGFAVVEKAGAFKTKAGLEGRAFGGTYRANGLNQMRSRIYMFIVNNQIYTVTVTCLASKWGAYQNAIDDCVSSLVIK